VTLLAVCLPFSHALQHSIYERRVPPSCCKRRGERTVAECCESPPCCFSGIQRDFPASLQLDCFAPNIAFLAISEAFRRLCNLRQLPVVEDIVDRSSSLRCISVLSDVCGPPRVCCNVILLFFVYKKLSVMIVSFSSIVVVQICDLIPHQKAC
jgi:hypothetical protein